MKKNDSGSVTGIQISDVYGLFLIVARLYTAPEHFINMTPQRFE